MKKKQIKKKEPQVVEIHIYVHQSNNIEQNPTGGYKIVEQLPNIYPITTC